MGMFKSPMKRLHHNAYVTADMEATRHFYEDLIGMPLTATWCESDVLFGKERTYCHCFFGLEDDSALAFFQFANPEDQREFGPRMPASPFHHIALHCDEATLDGIHARLKSAGFNEPKMYLLEHGYCTSLYATDPNGLILEMTVDNPAAEPGALDRKEMAHAELKRWLNGHYESNNTFRTALHS